MRQSNGRFQKGPTGNAGGRPKVLAEVRELAQQHGPEAIEGLIALARDKNAPAAARVAAYNALLDRGYGKPTQELTHHVDNQILSAEQREAENARLLADMRAALALRSNGEARESA
jgi:hypothetical protein